jgi:drug/metabolite transporter (DMT)-like permease
MEKNAQRLARLLLWTVPALWSSNYLIARAAHGVIAPHQLAFFRWLLALLLMLPFCWHAFAKAPAGWWRKEWPVLLLLGALGMWICGAWVYLGGQTTSAMNIGLIYATTPIGIALVSVWLGHEKLSRAQCLATALALMGVLHVVLKGDWSNLMALRFSAGDGWVLCASLSWVAYSLLLARKPSVLPPQARLAAIAAGGLLVLAPFTLLEAALLPSPPWSWAAFGLVLAAALLPGAMAYSAFSYVQQHLGPARTALMTYIAPLYAAVLAWALLGEPPQPHHALGAALILPSIWLATRR